LFDQSIFWLSQNSLVSLSNGSICVNTANDQWFGINWKSLISLGMMYCSKLSLSILSTFFEVNNPWTVQSFRNNFDSVKSTTGDKQDVLCIYLNKFWSGCLRPPLGGTLTTVPSNNFNKACCTSSRNITCNRWVVTLRAILSISSIKRFLFRLWQHHCLKQTCQDTLRLPNITGLC
jgi:hypothetical protein